MMTHTQAGITVCNIQSHNISGFGSLVNCIIISMDVTSPAAFSRQALSKEEASQALSKEVD